MSILTYRHTEFEETPVIPLMFLIHMERIEYVHSFFFSRVAELIPEIAYSKKIVMVTDDEKAITNAISKTWPDIPLFRCWIHAWRNMKLQLRKFNIRDKVGVTNYKTDFINLLLQKSEKSYKSVLAKFYLKKWDKVSFEMHKNHEIKEKIKILFIFQKFSTYYDKNIDTDINKMGSWILLKFGIKLLTNNQSESLNATMKRLMNWKRLSIDHMANSLRMIDAFFLMKIRRGKLGCQDYTLLPQLQEEFAGRANVGELPEFQSSEDLFKKIKSSRSSKHVIKINNLGLTINCIKILLYVFQEEDAVNSSEKPKSVVYHTPGDSVRQRAMEIIRENRIQLVPSLKHWSVVGSCGDIYVVTLFKSGVRNMTCTCVASALCSHILAAMYSIDCEMATKKKGNITVTQRKSRTRQRYRRSGLKKPPRLEKQL